MFLLLNAFLTGGLVKLYDDIKDNNLVNDEDEAKNTKMMILKMTIIVLFFITSMLDPTFLFISIFVAIPLCIYVGGIDIEFWKTLIYVSCIAFILNLDKMMNNMSHKMLLLLATGIMIVFEAKTFPEEMSTRKTNFRLLFTILGILAIYFSKGTSFEFIKVVVSFCVGCGVANLLFQHFYLIDRI